MSGWCINHKLTFQALSSKFKAFHLYFHWCYIETTVALEIKMESHKCLSLNNLSSVILNEYSLSLRKEKAKISCKIFHTLCIQLLVSRYEHRHIFKLDSVQWAKIEEHLRSVFLTSSRPVCMTCWKFRILNFRIWRTFSVLIIQVFEFQPVAFLRKHDTVFSLTIIT